jgi:hypothetical protein
MGGIFLHEAVAGFGARPQGPDRADPPRRTPRAVAIANGTLAAAVGLGLRLWIPGLATRRRVRTELAPKHQDLGTYVERRR